MNKKQKFDFNNLVNKEFDFYGAVENKFKLDDTVYEATRRKYKESVFLDKVNIINSDIVFSEKPIAKVKLFMVGGPDGDCFDGYKLKCIKTHVDLLQFGTDMCDHPFYFEFDIYKDGG